MKDNNANKVNCYQCIYYVVTWNPKMPKACKYFGFKSACQPSVMVYESTGSPCMAFVKKALKKGKI